MCEREEGDGRGCVICHMKRAWCVISPGAARLASLWEVEADT